MFSIYASTDRKELGRREEGGGRRVEEENEEEGRRGRLSETRDGWEKGGQRNGCQ